MATGIAAKLPESMTPGLPPQVKTRALPVATAGDAGWDESVLARALMQPFFDANPDFHSGVRVSGTATGTVVWAPVEFDLEQLFRRGDKKEVGAGPSDDFAAALLYLLRDRRVNPVLVSGQRTVHLRLGDAESCPLVCDFSRGPLTLPGTFLFLAGCPETLAGALRARTSYFFQAGNPLLGEKLFESQRRVFSIYRSTNRRGHVFYRGLKRAEIKGIPLVLVLKAEYRTIEKRLARAQDPQIFDEELLTVFYEVFARYGFCHGRPGEKVLVAAAWRRWEEGHPLLRAVARNQDDYWPERWRDEVFGDRYFAWSWPDTREQQRRYEAVQAQWLREGKVGLPVYFGSFGLRNAWEHCLELDLKAQAEREAVAPEKQRDGTTSRSLVQHPSSSAGPQ